MMRALLATAFVLFGCADAHDLIVDVRTDLVPGDEVARVRAELFHVSGGEPRAADDPRELELGEADRERLLRGRRLAEYRGLGPGDYLVDLTFLDAGGEVVVRRRTEHRLERTFALTVVVTRSCVGVVCTDGTRTECHGGRCVGPECSSARPEACGDGCSSAAECPPSAGCASPECVQGACLCAGGFAAGLDGGPGDAGGDAGPDAGTDAGTVTCVPGSCDDRNPCTTDDRCVDGVCLGDPVMCAGTGECQIGRCDLRTGACAVGPAPDGTACGRVGERKACCQGECTDIGTDPTNCGGCGLNCAPMQECTTEGGKSRCTCAIALQCPGFGSGWRCSAIFKVCECATDEACAPGQSCTDPGLLPSWCGYP